MTKEHLQGFRLLLETLLLETTASVERVGHELSRNINGCADENDQGSLEAERNILLAQADREARLIREIHGALRRLDSGEYGFCEACGEDIALRRLEVRPTARHCAQCQEMLEGRIGQGPFYDYEHDFF
ncbi:TraR/DksA family transcriptional regulator [Desulfonatronovibrio hydrogenovorans]|uniref:TraR/DksA family transcriptional regulator n=1 Tax=Desulfonatronovibrio hydrogenovorans TaxID=53245 RepID=UPI000690F9E2|nr:TraR/DksA C4-type zinc finger protein [Desulfonatronovibrio hydrogenovorans]